MNVNGRKKRSFSCHHPPLLVHGLLVRRHVCLLRLRIRVLSRLSVDLVGGVPVRVSAAVGVDAGKDEEDEMQKESPGAKDTARKRNAGARLQVASVDGDGGAVGGGGGAVGLVVLVYAGLRGAAAADVGADVASRDGGRVDVAGLGDEEGGRGVQVGEDDDAEEE